eukprot:6481836-Amphidinium_carterae.3
MEPSDPLIHIFYTMAESDRMLMLSVGGALEIARILPYVIHEAWVGEVFKRKLHAPTPGFASVTASQVLEADKALWQCLAHEATEGLHCRHLVLLSGVVTTLNNRCQSFTRPLSRLQWPPPLALITEADTNAKALPCPGGVD